MVVIAIVAVLAAVAVPAYRDYIIKSRIAVMVPIVDSYKDMISEYYSKTGNWPSSVDLNLGTAGVIDGSVFSAYLTDSEGIGVGNGWDGTNCTGANDTSFIVVVFDGEKLTGSTSFFNDPWGWGGTTNSLAWVTQLYTTSGNSIITSQCGSMGNVGDDYKYLPTNCQQDLSNWTPVCS